MNVSCACVPCAYSHDRACASTSRVRAWPSRCAFTSVRCIDVSCACAVTYRVRAWPSCVRVHERALQ